MIDSPDEPGWFFYKKRKNDEFVAVSVNDDGVCFAMDSEGNSFELEDTIGFWHPIEAP